MKKAFLLILALILVFNTTACGKKTNASSEESSKYKHNVDVVRKAQNGSIPEVDFVLGDPVDSVKNIMFEYQAGMTYNEFCDAMRSAGYEPDGETEYQGYVSFYDDGSHKIMSATLNDTATVNAIYNAENKDAGIAAIALVGDAFGYSGGTTVIDDVKSSIDAKFKESVCKGSKPYLPNGGNGLTCLTYDFDMYKLEMYFSAEYNTLTAAVLYDKNIW